MGDHNGGKTASKKVKEKELSDEQAKRSVVISNIPTGTTEEALIIHFQKTCKGGGEIEKLTMLDGGNAILMFEETKVAASVLKKEHKLGDGELKLKPYSKKEPVTAEMVDIFSLVSAKIDPAMFDVSPDEMDGVLSKIAEGTKIKYIQMCDGFFVSGSYKQVKATCVKLSALATPIEARSNDVACNNRDGSPENSQDVVLDVQPKLMQILHKDIENLQNKYKMTADHKTDKVRLRPQDGDWESFETGKEEFINIYQKAFQQMDQKSFEWSSDDHNIQQLFQEIMGKLDVVIELKNKRVSIYGKNEHVTQAFQCLQGNSRRSRRLYSPNSDILPKPDAFIRPPAQSLKQQLDNDVIVSVYQGDITKQRVDVIVNAANERLEHCGGVAAAIVKQGGYQIQIESRQIIQHDGKVSVGNVACTGPGQLPCKMIIHAVGPQWRAHGPEGSRQLISNACCQSFCIAAEYGFKSIVLPAISSGVFGVPKDICADVLFHSAEMFSFKCTSQNPLKDIRFVNIDSETNEAFTKEFHRRYLKSQGNYYRQINPNDSVPTSAINSSPPHEATLSADKTRNVQSYAGAASVKGEQQTRSNQLTCKNETLLTSYDGARKDQVRPTNHPTPGEAAAAAALKREEHGKKIFKTETSQQNISKGETSPSFEDGFENRQIEMSRGDSKPDNQEERRDSTDRKRVECVQQKPNVPSNNRDQQNRSTDQRQKQNDAKGTVRKDKLDKESQDREKFSSPNDTFKGIGKNANDNDQIVSSTDPKYQKHHEANESIREDKLDKESQHDTCKGLRGKENENPHNESKLRGAGRGRGAIGHVPFIAANLPGRAERVSPNQQLSTSAENDKYSPSASDLPDEAVSNASGTSEIYDDHRSHQGKRTSSSTGSKPEKTQTQHGSDRRHGPPSEESGPPGLGVTEEGMNLASQHNIEDVQKSSSSQQHESGKKDKNDACMKRRINDDSSDRSPKLRKQDIQESGEFADENEQNEKNKQNQKMYDDMGSTKQVESETNAADGDSQTDQPAETDSADNARGEKQIENMDRVQDDTFFSESNSKDTINTHHPKLEQPGDLEEETDKKVNKERESGNDKETKGNYISLTKEKEKQNESPCCNDLHLANEQLQENSMESFVVLETEGLISKVNAIDQKVEGSCSDESIVIVATVNECTRNELQSADVTQFTVSISAELNERSERGSYEGTPVPNTSESKEIMNNGTEVNTDGSKERTEETSPSLEDCNHENKNKIEETDSGKNERKVEPVESLTNLFQDLSTSDENTPKGESHAASKKECGLCKTAFSDANSEYILSGCGQVICTGCKVAFQGQKSCICPTYESKAGCNELQPPNGTMTTGVMEHSLAGFGDSKTMYIDYYFPSGIQGSRHPNPGSPYDPLTRRTFLPDTPEGRNVLELLHKAFDAGLLFTVGRCTVNSHSQNNKVIFSDVVDHKINLEGNENGYPDPNYLGRVVEKLQPLVENMSSPTLP